jgi:transketolase C-terminal domain/subunit
MTEEHTKGPWVWRGKDGGLYQEGTTHRFGEAVLVPSYEYDSGIDTVVSEADMALIAAAPDLLEALKKADQFMTNGIELGYIRMPTLPDPALATPGIVRAAIAKATGQKP